MEQDSHLRAKGHQLWMPARDRVFVDKPRREELPNPDPPPDRVALTRAVAEVRESSDAVTEATSVVAASGPQVSSASAQSARTGSTAAAGRKKAAEAGRPSRAVATMAIPGDSGGHRTGHTQPLVPAHVL